MSHAVRCLVLAAVAAAASATQTDNRGIVAPPTPGPIVIDGALDDWDLSGAISQCYDLETLGDIYSAKVAMMWDAQALYVGIRWKDPHPLGNQHDPRFQPGRGWAGDALQLRLKTDRIVHVTAWCHAPTQASAVQLSYGKSLTDAFGGGERMLIGVAGAPLGDGCEQAFRADSDGHGYVQELKLPWTLIGSGKAFTAGERIACGVELLWGEGDWPVHRYADNLAPGATSREFFWGEYNAWGPVTLSPTGKLSLPEPAWLRASREPEADGPVEIRYALDAPQRVTIAIDDAQGRRVRSLVAAAPREAGEHVERWDGTDDDGKAVAPGDYRWKALRHAGLHTEWVMSFASPGDPTWDTADGRGAFYADHSPAIAAAAAGDGVALACPVGEAGKHLIGCDLDGHRRWGLGHRGTGGRVSLATDGKILWVGNDGGRATIYRVDFASGSYAPWSATAPDVTGKAAPVLDLPVGAEAGEGKTENLVAIAVRDGLVAACLRREGLVRVLDATSGEERRRVALPDASAIAWLPDGSLVALAGARLVRIAADGAVAAFAEGDWSQANGLCADGDGAVYLTVGGDRQQVQVFDRAGAPTRTIGTRGGRPNHGPWQRDAMRNPGQPAIDARGRLWVPEATMNPKRTSVWDARSGALVRELVGTTTYAGAGAIAACEPTLAFSDNTVYHVDLATGAWEPTWSLGGTGGADDLFPARGDARSRTLARDGGVLWHVTTGTARASNEVHCTVRRDGRWTSGAHIGVVSNKHERVDEWAKYDHPFFEGHEGQLYAWTDADGDGVVQPTELVFTDVLVDGQKVALQSDYWGQLPDTDGAVPYAVQGQADRLVKIPVAGTSACGAPMWDVLHPVIVRTDRPIVTPGIGMIAGGSHGRIILNQDPFAVVEADGHVVGTYPSHLISVHGSHHATASKPGYLIGPSSILGSGDLGDAIGEVVYLNGNLGENYLLTHDGLWVQALFKDVRGWFESPERAQRGMAFDATTAGGESFGGAFFRLPSGDAYVVLGGTDARVIRVTGLDSLVRFGGTLRYDAAQYAAAQRLAATHAAARAVAKELRVPRRVGAIAVDGDLAEWPELADEALPAADLVDGRERFGRIALRWDDERVWIAWRARGRADRLRNAGQDERLLFKTGDCVDVMLAPAARPAGLRLLASAPAATPLAMLYEKEAADAAPADRATFSSPWRSIDFARVRRVDGLGVQVATGRADGGWTVEMSAPWALLAVEAKAGLKLRADLGILFADSGGTTTVARRYWSNQATNLVNDVPGEADLDPRLWGTLELAP